jgi:small basic protein
MADSDIKLEQRGFPPLVRSLAHLISYAFHPLFIPLYVGWFFVYVIRLFPSQDEHHKLLIMLQFFVNYTLLPMMTVLLLKGLGFIKTLQLKDQKDRIIPYVATGVFYFWAWWVFKNQSYPKPVVMFGLAAFLSSSAGLIFNSYLKISMHAISAGVVIALFMILGLRQFDNYGPYISMAVLVAGLIGTARLVLSGHKPNEIYLGLFLGSLMQLIAALVTS